MRRYLVLISLLLALSNSMAQFSNFKHDVDKIFEKEGEKYFCFQLDDRNVLKELSGIISIDNIRETAIYAYANKKEFSRFLAYGLKYEILPHPGDYEGELNMVDGINIRDITDWDFYPTYETYVDMMYQFAEDYPAICTVFSIGNSVQGREILVARISDNVNINENEPQFLYTSTMHGDETTAYILMLRLIDHLLSNYGTDDRITGLVDGIDIWINPLANPDGTYAGGNNTVNGARRYNALWVDLNRNYPDPKGGPHPDGNDWQAETIAFMDMAEENHFVAAANFHGGAEVCNYPWDTWPHLHADDDWWVYVCREWADTAQANSPAGYLTDLDNGITNGYAWYTTEGNRQDYMNYFQQCREFTMEISNTKLMPPNLLPNYWEYNYRSFLNYMEQCSFGIRGTVKDSTNNWPIYTEVKIMGHEMDSSWVYTDLPNGNYHRLVDEGTYAVVYSSEGYATKTKFGVQVQRKNATVMDVKLVPDGVGGIENNAVSKAILVYPNPVTEGEIHVSSTLHINTATIHNSAGKEVFKERIYSDRKLLTLPDLDAGIYFISFVTPKGSGVKKILIY